MTPAAEGHPWLDPRWKHRRIEESYPDHIQRLRQAAAVASSPQDLALRYAAARTALENRDARTVEALIGELGDSSRPEAPAWLAWTLAMRDWFGGDEARARAHLQHAIALFTELGDMDSRLNAEINLITILTPSADLDEVRALLRHPALTDARRPVLLNNLATMLLKTEHLSEALLTARHAAALYTQQGNLTGATIAWSNIGLSLSTFGAHTAALEAFSHGLSLTHERGPSQATARLHLLSARPLRGLGRLDDAARTLDRARALGLGKDWDVHAKETAELALARGRLDDAERAISTVLQGGPHPFVLLEGRLTLLEILRRRGETARAVALAAELEPLEMHRGHRVDLLCERAQLRHATGDAPGARVLLDEAEQLAGDDLPWVQVRVEQVRGEMAEADGDMGGALQSARRQLALQQKHARQTDQLLLATERAAHALDIQQRSHSHEDAALRSERKEQLRAARACEDAMLKLIHDLRTPLTVLKLELSMLPPSPDNREMLENTHEALDRINQMIEETLKAAQLANNALRLRPRPLDITPTIVQSAADARRTAQQKGIDLQARHRAPLHATVDDSALREILDNLLSNAVKFSAPGSQVWLRASPLPDGRCEIRVSDHGPGLSEEDQRSLFQRFTPLSARPTGGEPSTGLGLYIAHALTAAMGGELSCDSQLGEGATFTVRLPGAPPPAP